MTEKLSKQEAAPSVRDALQAAADSGDFERFRELLREVLDAQEALTGEVYEGRETYTRHDVCPPLADAELLYRWLPTYNPDATQSVADAQDARRWIPVTDRLPATGAYLTMNNHGQCGAHHFSAHLNAWSTRFGEEVTHWMPLPAPPGAAMALDVTKRDPNETLSNSTEHLPTAAGAPLETER
jgi:hypothetical protein